MSELSFVFLGLSITSSWGNGHATTYRGLVRELVRRGHEVLFLERDVPYYADNRDLPRPPYGELGLYQSLEELEDRYGRRVRAADVVIVGSYVPDGVQICDWICRDATGLRAFYDIDTPVTVRALEGSGTPYLEPRQVRRYDLYLSFTGGPLLDRLRRDFGAQAVKPLYCSADIESHYFEPRELSWDLGYLGTYSADRQPTLERLLLEPALDWRDGRFVVAGPQYPSALQWPENVARLTHVAPPEHRAFYNSQRFTLNVTRQDMVLAGYSPSVRLFEASACGTPVVSDIWPGIESFFEPDVEIVLARDSADVLQVLRSVPEEERIAIGRKAQKRVLAEHTAAHRAEQLEGYALELLEATRVRRPRSVARAALQPRGES